ncbi:unnamed protein product [Candida verbasci]|uniref:Uncharacterized protein n=1 Tax=Candida verbasci TaxID=1227364 RepID=A0A9W4TSE4_9ASCO|nr:unnamed protein product [Candida verbasci]
MSSEKEKLKAQEAQQNNQFNEAPPPYEQLQQQQAYSQQGYSQQGYGNYQQPQQQGNSQGYNEYDKPPATTQGYDVNQDPNVYKIAPDRVNITIAPPQHVHPQFQEYMANEPMRQARGDYLPQNNQFKHGAPLNRGHTSSNKQNKGFPGSSGVTYNNAANR